MNISSNSLFHYTPRFEYLQGILATGFEYRQSEEELPLAGYKNCIFDQLGITVPLHYPRVVCFCDLPFGWSRLHRVQYGNYVIGMTKEWGMRNCVTPIRYVHKQSPDFSHDFYDRVLDLPKYMRFKNTDLHGLFLEIIAQSDLAEAPSEEEMAALSPGVKNVMLAVNTAYLELISQIQRILPFVRLYEGVWRDRVTGEETNRVFYDEREWRAAAFDDEKAIPFRFDDIRHLIVSTEEERKQLAQQMLARKEFLLIKDETQIWSKIHTADSIYRDA